MPDGRTGAPIGALHRRPGALRANLIAGAAGILLSVHDRCPCRASRSAAQPPAGADDAVRYSILIRMGTPLRDAPISGTIHDFQKTSFGIKWLEESQCIYAWTTTTH